MLLTEDVRSRDISLEAVVVAEVLLAEYVWAVNRAAEPVRASNGTLTEDIRSSDCVARDLRVGRNY